MTLSFNKLNEIAGLYESIASSEQEQLNEIGGIGGQKALAAKQAQMKSDDKSAAAKNASDAAFSKKLDSARQQRFGGSNNSKPAAKPEPSKYKSSSDNKMYANYNDAKAARDSRLKSLAAKQQAAKPAPAPAAKPAPAAAKVTPTKPAAAGKSGMDIWKAKYANTLAKNVNPNGTQKGTGQSTMSKDAAELRSMQSKSTLKQSFEYDAYDLVLEYLLSQGHAETVAEAQYLMTEMDAEMIGEIVEGATGAYVPNSIDRSNSDRDMLRRQGVKNVSPNIPGPSGGGQFEKPSSNPAGVLRLAKTSSKSDTKTA